MSLPRPLKWQSGSARQQAKSISIETWEAHRDIIHAKYSGMKLAELMEWMKENHGFVATYAI